MWGETDLAEEDRLRVKSGGMKGARGAKLCHRLAQIYSGILREL